MNIQITITAETPDEFAAALRGITAPYHSSAPASAPPAPIQPPTPDTAITAPQYNPASGVQQSTPPIAPVQPPAAAPSAVPLAAAPTYTLDQIAKAGAELAQAGKMNELLGLLQQYGIQAVTQLKPEQIGTFATALRGLGAQL